MDELADFPSEDQDRLKKVSVDEIYRWSLCREPRSLRTAFMALKNGLQRAESRDLWRAMVASEEILRRGGYLSTTIVTYRWSLRRGAKDWLREKEEISMENGDQMEMGGDLPVFRQAEKVILAGATLWRLADWAKGSASESDAKILAGAVKIGQEKRAKNCLFLLEAMKLGKHGLGPTMLFPLKRFVMAVQEETTGPISFSDLEREILTEMSPREMGEIMKGLGKQWLYFMVREAMTEADQDAPLWMAEHVEEILKRRREKNYQLYGRDFQQSSKICAGLWQAKKVASVRKTEAREGIQAALVAASEIEAAKEVFKGEGVKSEGEETKSAKQELPFKDGLVKTMPVMKDSKGLEAVTVGELRQRLEPLGRDAQYLDYLLSHTSGEICTAAEVWDRAPALYAKAFPLFDYEERLSLVTRWRRHIDMVCGRIPEHVSVWELPRLKATSAKRLTRHLSTAEQACLEEKTLADLVAWSDPKGAKKVNFGGVERILRPHESRKLSYLLKEAFDVVLRAWPKTRVVDFDSVVRAYEGAICRFARASVGESTADLSSEEEETVEPVDSSVLTPTQPEPVYASVKDALSPEVLLEMLEAIESYLDDETAMPAMMTSFDRVKERLERVIAKKSPRPEPKQMAKERDEVLRSMRRWPMLAPYLRKALQYAAAGKAK